MQQVRDPAIKTRGRFSVCEGRLGEVYVCVGEEREEKVERERKGSSPQLIITLSLHNNRADKPRFVWSGIGPLTSDSWLIN